MADAAVGLAEVAPVQRGSRDSGKFEIALMRTAGLATLLLVWTLLSWWQGSLLIPAPWEIASELWVIVEDGLFFENLLDTIRRVVAGFAVAFVLSLAFGIAMGVSRRFEQFFEVMILVGLTVPGLIWALIGIMVIGVSEWAPVFAIAIVVTPAMTLNFWEGTKAVDQQLTLMARSFQASPGLRVRRVIFPQLLPYMFAAMRLGFSLAWKTVVLAELFGQSSGVGYWIHQNYGIFDMSGVLAWTLGFAIVMSLIEFLILRPLEKRASAWRLNAR